MEFCLRTDDAQRAIKLLSTTAKMNSTEFDGQVLMKVSEGEVLFLSNNGNAGISCRLPANVISVGQVNTIFGKVKTFIMTFSPWDGEVGVKEFRFKLDGAKLYIEAEIHNENGQVTKGNLKLETMQPSAFMSEIKVTEPNLILNSNVVKLAIEKGLYAIDKNSPADYVKGLRIFVDETTVRFTSTNGKVVSDFAVRGEKGVKEGEHFFSYDFLMGLRRLLSDDVQLFFELHRTKNILSFDNVVFWSKSLMYSEYPDYMGLFKLFDKTIDVDRETLYSGLSSVIDVLNADDYNRVTLEVADNKLSLKTDNSLFEYPGFQDAPEFVVDLDGRDLLDTLRALNDDVLKVKCLDETHGVIFESAGFEDHKSYVSNLIRR